MSGDFEIKENALKKLCGNLYQEHTVPAKTTLLEAGKISRNFYYIKEGAVRIWFNNDGKDYPAILF